MKFLEKYKIYSQHETGNLSGSIIIKEIEFKYKHFKQ